MQPIDRRLAFAHVVGVGYDLMRIGMLATTFLAVAACASEVSAATASPQPMLCPSLSEMDTATGNPITPASRSTAPTTRCAAPTAPLLVSARPGHKRGHAGHPSSGSGHSSRKTGAAAAVRIRLAQCAFNASSSVGYS
jgi:hypothetical protein